MVAALVIHRVEVLAALARDISDTRCNFRSGIEPHLRSGEVFVPLGGEFEA